jgi:hypothetical protein
MKNTGWNVAYIREEEEIKVILKKEQSKEA